MYLIEDAMRRAHRRPRVWGSGMADLGWSWLADLEWFLADLGEMFLFNLCRVLDLVVRVGSVRRFEY